jgi:hypothetical protein
MKWQKWLLGLAEKINADFEYKIIEQFHFNRLGRKPPDLIWKALSPGPVARLDAGGCRIGHELFLFGGVRLGGKAINFLDTFDLRREKWLPRLPLPSGIAQTHHGITSDDQRYIYLISGQLGSYCSPPTLSCFVFDTLQKSWRDFISLPKARYAPTIQIWNGRLHVMAGSKEDRNDPSTEHWSIAIAEGKALEDKWKNEIPIPRGGPHRASAVIDGKLYVFGGQEGDYIAIPGHPEFLCTGELTCDVVYSDTYMLESPSSSWKKMTDMPIAASHTENTICHQGSSIVLVGGQTYKDPKTAMVTLTDVIQIYNASKDTWKIVGQLPFCIKETVATYYNDHLYFTTGQRSQGYADPTAGMFERGIWKALIRPGFWS